MADVSHPVVRAHVAELKPQVRRRSAAARLMIVRQSASCTRASDGFSERWMLATWPWTLAASQAA